MEKVRVKTYHRLWSQRQDVGQSDDHNLDLTRIEEAHETQTLMD